MPARLLLPLPSHASPVVLTLGSHPLSAALDMPYPPLQMMLLQTHVYQPSRVTALEEFTANLDEDDDENGITAASVRELPSKELQGLWDTCVLLVAANCFSRTARSR